MLNENIRAIRKSKGLSQQELAVKLNVVRQTVSKWETGLSVPDSDMLLVLSGKKCRSTLEIFVKDDMVSVRPIHIRDEQLKSRMRTYSRKMMNQGS